MLTVTGVFDDVEPHVGRLLSSPRGRKALAFFSESRDSGFVLQNDQGHVDVIFPVEWREKPEREAAIRAFFASLGVAPWRDYLAGNGGVADATRILAYPLSGDVYEVAAIVMRVLTELCGIPSDQRLLIHVTEGLP